MNVKDYFTRIVLLDIDVMDYFIRAMPLDINIILNVCNKSTKTLLKGQNITLLVKVCKWYSSAYVACA